MQGLAARQAGLAYDFLAALGEFDAREGIAHFQGVKSSAHFVAWACSMSAGTAREHVRVARALRGLPRVSALMSDGRLSYSKVRELTRIADHLVEDELCELALELTASQLARTVSAYRSAAGTRIQNLAKRGFTVKDSPDGMTRITIVLAPEEAALVTAAVEAAARRSQPAPADAPVLPDGSQAEPGVGVPAGTRGRPVSPPDRVQAILDVAASYLDAVPGEPADDHTLVLVHVSAAQLLADGPGAPGASDQLVCHVEGRGPIEPATAQRLACTSTLLGVLVGADGDVLRLGRTRRLASRAQRRALRIRDKGMCQYPGCAQTTHLDAHHLTPWSTGGVTDLDAMTLLCRRHHVHVHEGGLRLTRLPEPRRGFHFALPDGRPITGTWLADASPEALEHLLAYAQSDVGHRTGRDDPPPDPARIFPPHAGIGFQLHECVRVLFDIQQPEPATAA